jgi:predicted CXXCH cytochrome family protein
MDSPPAAPPPPRRRAALPLGLALLALAGGAAFAFRYLRPAAAPTPPGPSAPPADDPRLTFDTPYRNVRPEVRYVGDAVCADCHAEIAARYRRHPMGRSFAPTAGPDAGAPDAPVPAEFDALGFHYRVERQGGRLVHRETRRDDKGKVVADRAAAVPFVIGSGSRGYTYLLADGDYLFQSPVSWYGQGKRWDLSPGYAAQNQHFNRPVIVECLYCHTNHVDAVEGAVNRYDLAAFRPEPVGCERCHGPGDLHVRRAAGGPVLRVSPPQGVQKAPPAADDTIVNPARLAPGLREAVCQQCHLQGAFRVVRRGRGPFDYRPGLPLQLFWSVFEWRPGLGPGGRAVGQVEQMYESRCFRGSGGRLGCTSCHDPHDKPEPAAAPAFYRKRCQQCHEEKPCSLPEAERRRQRADDSCVACHMPRAGTADIPHTAASDHRVPRRPGPAAAAPARRPAPGEAPLLPFYGDQAGPPRAEVERDLWVGAMTAAAAAPPAVRARLAAAALPALGRATEAVPDDVPAWEAKGMALEDLGRDAEALAAFDAALARAPRREVSLSEAGLTALRAGRNADAAGYWRRAVEVNPHRPHFHRRLAEALLAGGDRGAALAECGRALALDPADTDARLLRVACLLEAGRRAEARTAFEDLMALRPPRADELRRWFEQHDR